MRPASPRRAAGSKPAAARRRRSTIVARRSGLGHERNRILFALAPQRHINAGAARPPVFAACARVSGVLPAVLGVEEPGATRDAAVSPGHARLGPDLEPVLPAVPLAEALNALVIGEERARQFDGRGDQQPVVRVATLEMGGR